MSVFYCTSKLLEFLVRLLLNLYENTISNLVLEIIAHQGLDINLFEI